MLGMFPGLPPPPPLLFKPSKHIAVFSWPVISDSYDNELRNLLPAIHRSICGYPLPPLYRYQRGVWYAYRTPLCQSEEDAFAYALVGRGAIYPPRLSV